MIVLITSQRPIPHDDLQFGHDRFDYWLEKAQREGWTVLTDTFRVSGDHHHGPVFSVLVEKKP